MKLIQTPRQIQPLKNVVNNIMPNIFICKIDPIDGTMEDDIFNRLSIEYIKTRCHLQKISITTFEDLFNEIHKLDNNQIIDIHLIWYDDTVMVQSLNIGTTKIIVKRYINENETYTFSDSTPDKPIYRFCDISEDELYNIIRSTTICEGLHVYVNNDVKKIEFVDAFSETSSALIVNEDNKIKREPYIYITSNTTEDNIKKLISETNTEYIFALIDTDIGVISCVARESGQKNNLMSCLLKYDVYGDCYVWLNNTFDDVKPLRLTPELFNKLLKCDRSKYTDKVKQCDRFFNIYREIN